MDSAGPHQQSTTLESFGISSQLACRRVGHRQSRVAARNGLLLHIECSQPFGVHLCWQGQVREYAINHPRKGNLLTINADEDLIKYGLDHDVWYAWLLSPF